MSEHDDTMVAVATITARALRAEVRVAELERALGMVARMAIYGPGPDTTEAQTLATIAAFVEKRLAESNWCYRP